MVADELGDRWAGADQLEHIAIGIANEDRLSPAELAPPGDCNAVGLDEGFRVLRRRHLDRDVGDAGILLRLIHQDVLAGLGVRRPQQVDIDAARVKHDQGMPLVKAAIGDELEAQTFIEGNGAPAITDADADVIDVAHLKHGPTPLTLEAKPGHDVAAQCQGSHFHWRQA